jgi:hypothetical protein
MNDSIDAVREAMRQVVKGDDFEPATKLLQNVKPDAAVKVVAGLPYSLATNVAHADIWNRVWLARLEGNRRFNPFPDFPVVKEKDWVKVRDSFLKNLERAYEISCSEPFEHHCKTDDMAAKTLLKIAVHTSYHLGQFKLIKRALRSSAKS